MNGGSGDPRTTGQWLWSEVAARRGGFDGGCSEGRLPVPFLIERLGAASCPFFADWLFLVGGPDSPPSPSPPPECLPTRMRESGRGGGLFALCPYWSCSFGRASAPRFFGLRLGGALVSCRVFARLALMLCLFHAVSLGILTALWPRSWATEFCVII